MLSQSLLYVLEFYEACSVPPHVDHEMISQTIGKQHVEAGATQNTPRICSGGAVLERGLAGRSRWG